MGYTHYWNYKNPKAEDTAKATTIVKEMKKMLLHLPERSKTGGGFYIDDRIVIKNGLGEKIPLINTTEILFNGDASVGFDHETFAFEFGKQIDFDFCKTARKPYDFFVCACILSLANHLEGFEFSSDGGFDDWKPALDFYIEMFGDSVSDNLTKVFLDNFEKDLVSK